MSELRSSEPFLCLRYIYQNVGATLLRTGIESYSNLPKCRSYAPQDIFYVFATSTKMSELRSSGHLLCRCYIYQNTGATLLRIFFMSLLHLPKCRSCAPGEGVAAVIIGSGDWVWLQGGGGFFVAFPGDDVFQFCG